MAAILGIYASQISGHLYAGPYGAYDALASVTLASGASSVTFTGIPDTYKHLQIRQLVNSPTGNQQIQVGNGTVDTGANYVFHFLYGEGANAGSAASTSETKGYTGYANGSTYPFTAVSDILDYRKNTNKTIRTLSGQDNNGSAAYVMLTSSLWMNTNPITAITISNNGGNYLTNSTFALYGVK
jgi:hypothetical protein